MSYSRIFQPVPLEIAALVRLDTKASHYVSNVLRAEVGDNLILFNGQGGDYLATITKIDKKGVEVEIKTFNQREVESPLHIHLAQGIVKGEKMDMIVQKAVELGVKTITPLITERCNVRLDSEREAKRLMHWQAIAASACEQSGRNQLPHIALPLALPEWLDQIEADKFFVLSPHSKEKLTDHIFLDTTHSRGTTSKQPTIALLIGPEGGLSPNEIEAAIQHKFLPLNLGPRILRAETATIAALSILQFQHGDMA